ncbi:MAG: DNA damage-inducible protein D [Tistlia sp.]|uniref:DNA damage-inducible protein D n=1 Tax=Tistlia sp. TaxID=3057121 RepID=UPI0034A22802
MPDVTELPEAPNYKATMERLREIQHVSPSGADYWLAREICPVLGYTWEGFEGAMDRALSACAGIGVTPRHHFRQTSAMMRLGKGGQRKVPDWFLSRTACYLVAMNGDPTKPEIAAAQAYFTVQTRRMELRDASDAQLAHDERRLELRERVTNSHKRVSKAAQEAGVRPTHQGVFHDARYRGLYGAPLKEVLDRKGLTPGEKLMDRAGPLELSANDFQMNLATQVLSREGVNSESTAIRRNRDVAERVRQVIAESGSALPEDLPVEPPIKEVKARLRTQKKLKGPPT